MKGMEPEPVMITVWIGWKLTANTLVVRSFAGVLCQNERVILTQGLNEQHPISGQPHVKKKKAPQK